MYLSNVFDLIDCNLAICTGFVKRCFDGILGLQLKSKENDKNRFPKDTKTRFSLLLISDKPGLRQFHWHACFRYCLNYFCIKQLRIYVYMYYLLCLCGINKKRLKQIEASQIQVDLCKRSCL